jgi:hypothetical protein
VAGELFVCHLMGVKILNDPKTGGNCLLVWMEDPLAPTNTSHSVADFWATVYTFLSFLMFENWSISGCDFDGKAPGLKTRETNRKNCLYVHIDNGLEYYFSLSTKSMRFQFSGRHMSEWLFLRSIPCTRRVRRQKLT